MTPEQQRPPPVSVVVPVRDDVEGLAECLAAVERQEYDGEVEVVVVDSASTRDLAPALAGRDVTTVAVAGPGSYRARNAGLARATGEVIAFTDADCRPHPEWLAVAVRHLRAGADRVAGAVEVTVADPHRPTSVELFEQFFGFPQDHYARDRGWGATANLVTWRHVFDDVGGFRDDLESGGDQEWGLRAAAAGHGIVFAAGATVAHPARRTLRELARKRRRTLRGAAQLARDGAGDAPPRWRQLVVPSRVTVARVIRADHLRPRDRGRVLAVAVLSGWVALGELVRLRARR